jgi:hypothetical protein
MYDVAVKILNAKEIEESFLKSLHFRILYVSEEFTMM